MHGRVNPFGGYKRYKTRKAVVLDSLFVKNVINLWFCLLKNYFATVNFRASVLILYLLRLQALVRE